jgi:hypothetical protein
MAEPMPWSAFNRRVFLAALVLSPSVHVTRAQNPPTTAQEVRMLIAKELKRGTAHQQIEEFLQRYTMAFGYDDIFNRYDALIRRTQFEGVSIVIYVDMDRRFVRAEVNDFFTGL